MSPQRIVQGTRVWVELPDGFGRHGALILDLKSHHLPVELLEATLLVMHVPDSERDKLADLGRIEPGVAVELPGVGRWRIFRMDGELTWERDTRAHRIYLRLVPA